MIPPGTSWPNIFFLLSAFIPTASSVICMNCQGWSGRGYTPRFSTVSTCDSQNNACVSTMFCVKIVNPILPKRHYVTFTSQCWNQNNLQQSPTNLVTVSNKVCYNYTDAAVPPNTYRYCFCNDRDYCNSTGRAGIALFLLVLISCNLISFK